ncbi:MAG: sodium:proton antiporter [Planctomycetaceae bacterium]|nr:sodium:proton antiporter [Planctomycetaceae bacterium]
MLDRCCGLVATGTNGLEGISFELMVIIGVGIGAQWLASRLRIPSILLLLGAGILAGPALGIVGPEELLQDLLFPFVSMCVAIILFEGAMSLRFQELAGVGAPLVRLLTFGVVITWGLTTLLAHFVLGMSWFSSTLLGAILVVTGPTVIGPLLRQLRPVGLAGPISRWEGIIIDPIGAVLAVLVFQTQSAFHTGSTEHDAHNPLLLLGGTLLVGIVIGTACAWILSYALRHHAIPDHLESPVTLAVVIAAFTLSNQLRHEAGLVTVTVMGIAMANTHVSLRHIIEFKENLSVLLISTLFVLLSARLDLNEFTALGWQGGLFVLLLILIVRPVSVFLPLWGTRVLLRDRVLLACLAPRGIVAAAVASVFALQLGNAAPKLVPATFMVIIGTVVVYSLATPHIARWLKLSSPNPQGILIVGASSFARAFGSAVQEAGFPVLLVDANHSRTLEARLAGLRTSSVNILSESAIQDLDLGGIGRYMGMTENDEVNTMGGFHFAEVFGKSNVYQLSPRKGSAAAKDPNAAHLNLRYLFREEDSFTSLAERIEYCDIKVTPLTDEFTWEDFQQRHPNAQILGTITQGQLSLVDWEAELSPGPGTKLVLMEEKSSNVQLPES